MFVNIWQMLRSLWGKIPLFWLPHICAVVFFTALLCLSILLNGKIIYNVHVPFWYERRSEDYYNISNEMKLQSKMIVREMILNEMKVSFFTIYLSDSRCRLISIWLPHWMLMLLLLPTLKRIIGCWVFMRFLLSNFHVSNKQSANHTI